MKPMKQIPTWLSLFVMSLLLGGFFMKVGAVPQLPKSELTWKNVTVGGKKTAVFCMFRDSHGIMWVGTNSGLYFYDGVTVHPIGENELFGAQIYSIVEKDGQLYIGSNNGLLVYDYKTGVVNLGTAPLPKEIRCLLLYDSYLWVGSLYGMFRFSLNDGSVTDFSAGLPHKSVYSLLRDSRGILYAGTYNGLARWNSTTNKFTKVKEAMDPLGLKNLFVNCLLESPDNSRIYIGSEGSLYEYTPVNDTWKKITALEHNNIKSMAKGHNDHILIGTDNGVFDWYQDSIRHYRHDSRHELSLSDNEIWCILADSGHTVWTGHERGFSIASNSTTIRTIKLSTLAHTGEGNEIYAIYRDSSGHLWLGGTNGAIKLSDGESPHWYRHSDSSTSLSHNRIRAIDEDSNHHIWFSTDGGLNRFNPLLNGFDVFHIVDENGEHSSNWVYSFEEDDDCYWIGSFLSGLHRVQKSKFDTNGGTVVADYSLNTDSKSLNGNTLSMANDLINDMVTDIDGHIWILLFKDNILTKYSPSDDTLEKYDVFQLTGGYPTHLSRDEKGRIWCAFKGGTIVFDSKGNHEIVKFPYTNSDEAILAIGKVGNGMWVSTQSNVWSIDGETLKTSLLPIPQKSYTAVYEDTATGKVLLGGTDEVLEVDRHTIGHIADYKAIKLVLHDKGGGRFDLSDLEGGKKGVSIPYGGRITLVVSTLDYSSASPQRFMYRLAKSEADTSDGWMVMPEGANTISFFDLKMEITRFW